MRWWLSCAIACIGLIASEFVNAEEPPKRSAELQVLDRLIGDWETVLTPTGAGVNMVISESRHWSRRGTFVLSENYDQTNKIESLVTFTYDPKSKQYRSCIFFNGGTAESLGKWDEAKQTMTWKGDAGASSVYRYLDQDHVELTISSTTPEGKVVVDFTAKQTRVKK